MSNVLDLREARKEVAPVASLEAEHQVLGAAMFDNALIDHAGPLMPSHFAEPVHGRAWAAIQSVMADGVEANIVTVAARLGSDPGFAELGSGKWLFDLVDRAAGHAAAMAASASLTIDMHARREVLTIADKAREAVRSGAGASAAIGDMESALLALKTHEKRAEIVSAAQAVAGVLAYIEASEGDLAGVRTGIDPLDEALGPLLPDDLILLAGRPGMGKSAAGGCIALNVARTGAGVIEINSEMSIAQMMRRHFTDVAFAEFGEDAPTYKDIRRRSLTANQRGILEHASRSIAPLPLALVKRTGLTIAALRSLVRRQAAEWAAAGITLGLVTIDHVGLLDDPDARDRYTAQTSIAIALKRLADELAVPVLAMVQLNRAIEQRDNKKPMLADMRDTGAWEENADTVIGVYRDSYYAKKEGEPKRGVSAASLNTWAEWDQRTRSKNIEAIILKVREGEEKTVNLWASIGHNAIRGCAPHDGGFL